MASETRAFDLPSFISESNAVIGELRKESDRGAALVGVEYIHQLVERLVYAHAIDDPRHLKRLLKYPGALVTAASRIDLAYALGWIGEQVFHDLGVAREIRNLFAHSPSSLSFEDEPLREKCGRLKALAFSRPYRVRKARDQFLFGMLMLALQLTELLRLAKAPNKGVDPPITRVGNHLGANRGRPN
jgi:DNA-binding MltR family transcriptional regulator